jgi:hypothetical protein
LPGGAEEGCADGVRQRGFRCTHIRYARTRHGFVRQADSSGADGGLS